MTGRGIGRYGSGQLPDVTIDPAGQLDPIRETTMLLGNIASVSPMLNIYGYAGKETEMPNTGSWHRASWIGYPNYSLAGCFAEGGSCSPNIHLSNELQPNSGGSYIRANSTACSSEHSFPTIISHPSPD